MASTVLGFAKPALLATPTKAGVATVTQSQLPPSQAVPSSTTQPGHLSRAQADSSRKEKVGPVPPPERLPCECPPPQPCVCAAEAADPGEGRQRGEDRHQTLLPKEGNHKGRIQGDRPQSRGEGEHKLRPLRSVRPTTSGASGTAGEQGGGHVNAGLSFEKLQNLRNKVWLRAEL